MVTAPDVDVVTPAWADDLLDAGADVLRINAAHGCIEDWATIASTFKQQAAARGLPGRVIVDMPGPKLRVEICELRDAVLHLPRRKDRCGRTVEPTVLKLAAEYDEDVHLVVPAEWLAQLAPRDVIELGDAGGRRRKLAIEQRLETGVRASCQRSLYLTPGLPLTWRRGVQVLGEGARRRDASAAGGSCAWALATRSSSTPRATATIPRFPPWLFQNRRSSSKCVPVSGSSSTTAN